MNVEQRKCTVSGAVCAGGNNDDALQFLTFDVHQRPSTLRHISPRSSTDKISRIWVVKFFMSPDINSLFLSVSGRWDNMFVPDWHSFILCIRVMRSMRSMRMKRRIRMVRMMRMIDEDDDDGEDDEDEGEDDEWQRVCSDLTLFHAAQRVEDQIALAGHSPLLANNFFFFSE